MRFQLPSDKIPVSMDLRQLGKLLGYFTEKPGLCELQTQLDPGLPSPLQLSCVGLRFSLALIAYLASSQSSNPTFLPVLEATPPAPGCPLLCQPHYCTRTVRLGDHGICCSREEDGDL